MKSKEPARAWERQSGESNKAYGYFSIYRDQDRSKRSIRRTAELVNRDRRGLENISSKWHWVERAKQYDDYLDTLQLRQREDDVKDAHEFHRSTARVLLEKLLVKIKNLDSDEITVQSLSNLLKVATDIELRSLGELSSRVEIVDDRSDKVSVVFPQDEDHAFKDTDKVSVE